jgi:diadenosine tetraphosphate (Ap4A) HIT family hydrolase
MDKHNFRIWDPENQFSEGFIKKFKYWTFEVSYRQHTLGSFLILLNRPAERISQLTPSELVALGKIMKFAESAINKTFQPDRYNYLQLGNGIKHLHFHGIPRYKTKRIFAGRTWIDNNFGLPPLWSYQNVSHELVRKLNREITKNLPKTKTTNPTIIK